MAKKKGAAKRKKKADVKDEMQDKFGPKLPQAVLDQASAAEKALEGEPDKPEAPDPEPAPKADPEPEPVADKVVEEEVTPQIIDTPDDDPATEGNWEQRYRVLKGKYDAEVPNLRSVSASLEDKVRSLEAIVANQEEVLKAHTLANANLRAEKEANVGSTEPAVKQANALNAEDYEGYGDEIVTLVETMNSVLARNTQLEQAVQQQQPAADTELTKRLEAVEGTVHQSAQEKYFSALDAGMPDWNKINIDPKFASWVQKVDPYANVKIVDLLQHAAASHDANRVLAFFKRFRSEVYGDKGDAPDSPAYTPPKKEDYHSPDDALIDHEAEESQNGSHTTKADFQAAVTRYTHGKITEAEFNQISASYQAAIKKGLEKP